MNKLIVTLFSFCVVSCNGLNANINLSYDGQKAPCLSKPQTDKKHINSHVKRLVSQSLKHKYNSPLSVWDKNTLNSNPQLSQALKEYTEGKRGLSVKNLSVENKTPQYIHHKLLHAGFNHQRIPFVVNPNDKVKHYWRLDGSKTSLANAKGIVCMDVYSHKDGGIVRVKPLGVPDPKNPRPQPHAAKSVALDPNNYNLTSWQNEAFKVTNDGQPVPKAPSREFGLKLNEPEILKYIEKQSPILENVLDSWKDAVMDNAHIDINVDFSHCKG
jgi:hypothetical protein